MGCGFPASIAAIAAIAPGDRHELTPFSTISISIGLRMLGGYRLDPWPVHAHVAAGRRGGMAAGVERETCVLPASRPPGQKRCGSRADRRNLA